MTRKRGAWHCLKLSGSHAPQGQPLGVERTTLARPAGFGIVALMNATESIRVAAVQLQSRDDVPTNLQACEHAIAEAAERGATFVVLPENFAYFGSSIGKRASAEPLGSSPGPIMSSLIHCARNRGVTVLGGGWPEASKDPARPFNSATVISPSGDVTANYRKIHLFDVTLPSGVKIQESMAMTAGSEIATCTVDGFRIGLSICYDIRFPELYRKLVDRGCEVLCVPSAFTLETGRDHWTLLVRARAVESQCWVIAANQCGSHPTGKTTYGHSMIVDPWGRVLAEAADGPGVIVADLDRQVLSDIRASLPALKHRRLL
jgi:predicted amidohydrolase